MTDCPYANECTKNNSWCCESCRHKRGKKDHYDPIRPLNPSPWNPRPIPYNPIWINYQEKIGTNCCGEKQFMTGPKPDPKLRTPYFLS